MMRGRISTSSQCFFHLLYVYVDEVDGGAVMGVGVDCTPTEVHRLYLTSVCAFVPNPHPPFLDCNRVTPSSPFYSTVAVMLYFSSASLFSYFGCMF